MTDITRLLASLKRRSAHAKEFGHDILFVKLEDLDALVEALEKAQQVHEELCKLLPPGVEYMDPPDGGDVTPLEGVRRMVADYRQRIAELEEAEQQLCAANVTLDARAELAERQLAELESRLNSADKLQDSAFRSGLQHGFSLGQTDDQKGYEQSMAAYSPDAGIEWEAE